MVTVKLKQKLCTLMCTALIVASTVPVTAGTVSSDHITGGGLFEIQRVIEVEHTGGVRNGLVAYKDQTGKIKAAAKKIEISLGETKQLNYTGITADTRAVAFISKRPDVVQVDADGVVKGIRTGSSVVEMWYNGKKAKTRVKVKRSKEKGTQNLIENYSGNGRKKPMTFKVKGVRKSDMTCSQNEKTEVVIESHGDSIKYDTTENFVTTQYGTVSYCTYKENPKAVNTDLKIAIGETKTLQTEGVVEGVKWRSSKRKFLQVDGLGRITAIKAKGKLNNKPVKVKVTGRVGRKKLKYNVIIDPTKIANTDPDIVANRVRVNSNTVYSISPGGRILNAEPEVRVNTYKIKYNLSDSNSISKAVMNNPITEYKADGTEHKLPVPNRVGYSFKGWKYTDESGQSNVIDAIPSDAETDISLTAYWVPNKYTVKLDDCTGRKVGTSDTQSLEVDFESKLPSVDVPVRDGYTFLGYFTEDGENGIKLIDSDGTTEFILNEASDVTLYAHWKKNEKPSEDTPSEDKPSEDKPSEEQPKATKLEVAYIIPSIKGSSLGDYISYNNDSLTTKTLSIEQDAVVGEVKTLEAPELNGFTLVGIEESDTSNIQSINEKVKAKNYAKYIQYGESGASENSKKITVSDSNAVILFIYARNKYKITVSTNCQGIETTKLSKDEAGSWSDNLIYGETVDVSKYSDEIVQDGYELDYVACNGNKVAKELVIKGESNILVSMHPIVNTETVRQMGLGWNLGKTFGIGERESNKNWDDIKARIDSAYDMGFTNIRIQTTLAAYMNDDYTDIADKYKETWTLYKKTVKYCQDKGLYVIIGDACLGDVGVQGAILKPKSWDLSEVETDKFKTEWTNLWKFIIDEFKDYDYHVVFQAYNEPCNWDGDISGYGYGDYKSNPSYVRQDSEYFAGRCENLKHIMMVNSIFAKLMKEYDPERYYMISSYNANVKAAYYNYFDKTWENWNDQFVNYDTYGGEWYKTFWYPKDVDQTKAIYSCHIYDHGDNFVSQVKELQRKFKADGINLPIYVDETGTQRKWQTDDAISTYVKEAKAIQELDMAGMALWDDTQDMSYMNYGTWDWYNEKLVRALIEASGQKPRED